MQGSCVVDATEAVVDELGSVLPEGKADDTENGCRLCGVDWDCKDWLFGVEPGNVVYCDA